MINVKCLTRYAHLDLFCHSKLCHHHEQFSHFYLFFISVESGVVLWDERYSSWEAKTRLKENYDISSGTIDIMSAICILEHYLEEGGKGSEVVKPSQKARKLRHKAKSTIRK